MREGGWPLPPDIPDKVYFRIGEVSEIVGVEPHVLRFWESEFPQVRPDRAESKQRLYTRRHLELFLEIKNLLYDDLYTIAGAKKQLGAQPVTESAPSSILQEVKSSLLEIKKVLET